MFPLAKTGMDTASLTALIFSQSARPCGGKLNFTAKESRVIRWAHRIVPSLFPKTAMAGDDLCPGSFEHPGVFYRLFDGWEDPELCCHGNG